MHLFRTALACGGLAAALAAPAAPVAAPVADTLAQRLVPCTSCHGREGRAAPDGYHPRIAGKPAGYLYNQLLNFREGRRRYAPMVYLVDPLSDAYLKEIAEHFAALELPYPPPAPAREGAEVLQRGEQLVRRGDATRELPACTGCHGERLTGVAPAVPGLLGLPRDYLGAQLGAWVSGQRRAQAPDCMATIARKLTPADVAAVTAWLASRPVPEPAKAAAAFDHPPPLECGGLPR